MGRRWREAAERRANSSAYASNCKRMLALDRVSLYPAIVQNGTGAAFTMEKPVKFYDLIMDLGK